jgi:hypothetical protein
MQAVTVLHHVFYLTAAGALFAAGSIPALTATPVERVAINDNTHAAGTADEDVVTVRLRAAVGMWRPEGDGGPTLRVEALGEQGKALMVPAPLLRVVEGTTLVVSVRNDLPSPLRVHGLCARDGAACAPLDVPPGADREVRFASGRAGTYHYWATTIGAPIPFREMGGAFVVDPAGVPAGPDRIFVITEWSDLKPAQLREIMASDDSSARFLAANPKDADELLKIGDAPIPKGVKPAEKAEEEKKPASEEKPGEESDPKNCVICHQTYQPQGDSSEEYVTKPPKGIGDAFWLKKGSFKTIPVSHAPCASCHNTDAGIEPAPSKCDACHKLLPAQTIAADFDPKLTAKMGILDRTILARWRRRESSGTFPHGGGMHPTLNCTSCHNVPSMNTVEAKTLQVSVKSCGGAEGCHITASLDEGGALNFEIDQRKTKADFQCTKCHLVFGSKPIPANHVQAITKTGTK